MSQLRPLMQEYEVTFTHVIKKRFHATSITDAERTVRLMMSDKADLRVASIIPTKETGK